MKINWQFRYNRSMLTQKIVAIGASTVFGRVDPKGGGYIGRLKTWHESNALKNAVFNLGIGGDTSTEVLKRLMSEVSIRQPDLIIVSLGLNDTARKDSKTNPSQTSLEQFKKNAKKIFSQAQSLAPVVFVSISPIHESKTIPLDGKNSYYLLKDAEIYSQATKEICRSMNISYLDIFTPLMNMDYKQLLYEDGLHLNEQGHIWVFEELKKFLQHMYPD